MAWIWDVTSNFRLKLHQESEGNFPRFCRSIGGSNSQVLSYGRRGAHNNNPSGSKSKEVEEVFSWTKFHDEEGEVYVCSFYTLMDNNAEAGPKAEAKTNADAHEDHTSEKRSRSRKFAVQDEINSSLRSIVQHSPTQVGRGSETSGDKDKEKDKPLLPQSMVLQSKGTSRCIQVDGSGNNNSNNSNNSNISNTNTNNTNTNSPGGGHTSVNATANPSAPKGIYIVKKLANDVCSVTFVRSLPTHSSGYGAAAHLGGGVSHLLGGVGAASHAASNASAKLPTNSNFDFGPLLMVPRLQRYFRRGGAVVDAEIRRHFTEVRLPSALLKMTGRGDGDDSDDGDEGHVDACRKFINDNFANMINSGSGGQGGGVPHRKSNSKSKSKSKRVSAAASADSSWTVSNLCSDAIVKLKFRSSLIPPLPPSSGCTFANVLCLPPPPPRRLFTYGRGSAVVDADVAETLAFFWDGESSALRNADEFQDDGTLRRQVVEIRSEFEQVVMYAERKGGGRTKTKAKTKGTGSRGTHGTADIGSVSRVFERQTWAPMKSGVGVSPTKRASFAKDKHKHTSR